MSDFKHSMRNPHGLLIITSEAGEVRIDTYQCVHCGKHCEHKPGSGKIKKFCGNCNGFTCAARQCVEHCIPQEQMIENIEQGKSLDHRRILVPSGYNL